MLCPSQAELDRSRTVVAFQLLVHEASDVVCKAGHGECVRACVWEKSSYLHSVNTKLVVGLAPSHSSFVVQFFVDAEAR